jgi:hypothetical protein
VDHSGSDTTTTTTHIHFDLVQFALIQFDLCPPELKGTITTIQGYLVHKKTLTPL